LSVTHAIRRRHNARLTAHDLSVPRARLLEAMIELERPRMSDLAEFLGLSPRTITTAVDALERDGLLARLADPQDRRVTLVTLTPAGRALFESVAAYHRQLSEVVMAPLSADERRVLWDLLTRIRTEGLAEFGEAPDQAPGQRC
jgi:DNA-binding MarR family transcriptional regulator